MLLNLVFDNVSLQCILSGTLRCPCDPFVTGDVGVGPIVRGASARLPHVHLFPSGEMLCFEISNYFQDGGQMVVIFSLNIKIRHARYSELEKQREGINSL